MKTRNENTEFLIVSPYVKMRDSLIENILMDVKQVYPKDKEFLDCVVNLTTTLMTAEPDAKFVQDLQGFRIWAATTKQKTSSVVTTIVHDLSEFARNRKESWFCPRTTGYAKYLTGASNKAA